MEKKQLNLNAPFYSARRYSSPSSRSSEPPTNIRDHKPLLPPSRQQSLNLLKFEHGEEDDNEVIKTKPTSSVPFRWEQTPGRPKYHTNSLRFHSGEIPKLPPCRLSSGPLLRLERSNDQNLLYKPNVEAFSFVDLDDHDILLEKLDQSLKCATESEGEEEEDDEYSDVVDALSFGELQQSLNESNGGGAEPSGTFSVDAQTRDLMMKRFLPAAKAAVLETHAPQYNAKKKKVVSGDVFQKKRTTVEERYVGAEFPRRNYNIDFTDDNNKKEEGSEEDECVEKRRTPIKKKAWISKRWGAIIPLFCARSSSLCLVNPLPALKAESRPQTPSPFGQVGRITRKALSGPLDKIACTMPHKKKFHSGLLPRELPSAEHKKLSRDSSNKFTPNSRGSYSLSTSPLRRYRSGNSSPCGNEIPPKSPSPFSRKKVADENRHLDGQLASSRKLFKALQDVSRNQKNNGQRSPERKSLDIESPRPYKDEDGYEVKRVIREERKVEESNEFAFVVKSPFPPPLPKSPEESWLWRTLPSLGNPFSHSSRKSAVGPTKDDVDPKWEAIVKSANLRLETVRYSQQHRPKK